MTPDAHCLWFHDRPVGLTELSQIHGREAREDRPRRHLENVCGTVKLLECLERVSILTHDLKTSFLVEGLHARPVDAHARPASGFQGVHGGDQERHAKTSAPEFV